MNNRKGLILCFIVLLFCILLQAQPQELIWTTQVPSQIRGIDANSQGFVVTIGAPTDTNYQVASICVHDSSGTLQWEKMIGFQGAAGVVMDISQIKINDNNEVYFYSKQTLLYITEYTGMGGVPYNGISLTPGLTKLSSTGAYLWHKDISQVETGSVIINVNNENVIVSCNGQGVGSAYIGGSLPSLNPPGGVYVGFYTIIVVFDNTGLRLSYKLLTSNWICNNKAAYLNGTDLYISGDYYKGQGATSPPAVLYFENTVNGNTTVFYLYEEPGNKFLAKLDLTTNNWLWYKNITTNNHTMCRVNDYLYIAQKYSTEVYKYSSSTGIALGNASYDGLSIRRLYTTIDERIHFIGITYSPTWQPSTINGIIETNLTMLENFVVQYAESSYGYSNDYLGNQYVPYTPRSNTNGNDEPSRTIGYLAKFGYPHAYLLREQEGDINFGACYPNVQYQQSISVTNIGNALLSVTGLQFINNTPGLSATVTGSSSATAGNSIQITVSCTLIAIGAFSDTLVVISNSPYVPSYKVKISGNVLSAPPLEPANLNIVMAGNNVIISWEAVTLTMFDTPIEPDFYLVFVSADPYSGFTYHGATDGLQYTHFMVGAFNPRMFYRVTAYKFDGRGTANLVELGLQPGMPEEKVMKLLKAR